MGTNVIADWLDIAPQWMSFALRFPTSPKSALKPYAATGAVSRDLTLLAVGGVAVSYIITAVAAPRSLGSDPSSFLRLLRKVDLNLIPPALLIVLVVSAVAIHLVARLAAATGFVSRPPRWWDPHLGGTVEDSTNGILAFASVYLPFATSLFLVTMQVAVPGKPFPILAILCLLGAVTGLLVYLPLALAAVHPQTSFSQALVTFCFGYSFPVGVLLLLNTLRESFGANGTS